MDVFKSVKAYALLRRATVKLVCRNNDVMGTWHSFKALTTPLNTVCGYDNTDTKLKAVDTLMLASAFETKNEQTCIQYSCVDSDCDDGEDRFIHLKIGNDGKATHVACSKSNNAAQLFNVNGDTPTEWFGVNDETQLWDGSKDRLRKFLKQRKQADGYNSQRCEQRGVVSNIKRDTRSAGAAGQTPDPKRQRGGNDFTNRDDDADTRIDNDSQRDDDNTPESGILEPSQLFPDTATIVDDNTPQQPPQQQQQQQPPLESLLFDENGNIKDEVANVMMVNLKSKYDQKKSLTLEENRLLGCLAEVEMKAKKKDGTTIHSVNVKSFKQERHRGFRLCRAPTRYNSDTTTTISARSERDLKQKARDWFGVISDTGFNLGFLLDQVEQLNEAGKTAIRKAVFDPLSTEETIQLQKWCNIGNEAMKRLKRFLRFKFGFRMMASEHSVRDTKNDFFDSECLTAESRLVTLQRPVQKTKNGTNIITRDVPVLVYTTRPLEHILRALTGLLRSGKFRSRQGGPGELSPAHKEKAVVKLSADAGGGNFHFNVNAVNVDNPQGQEHQHIVGSFPGIKDTPSNVYNAFFNDDNWPNGVSTTRGDTESILQRRCNMLCVTRGEALECIIVVNVDEDHDDAKPKPLPKLEESATDVVADINDENKLGIGSLKFDDVTKVKLVQDNEQQLIGISFFGSDESCIATVMFRNKIAAASGGGTTMDQYMIIGGFATDMELWSGIIGHQGASATFPSFVNYGKLADVKKMWEPGNPVFQLRTNESTNEDYRLYNENYEMKPPAEKKKELRTEVTRTQSHSIHAPKMFNFPFDAMIPSPMHFRTGGSRSLVDFIFDLYGKVSESLPDDHASSRKAIEREICNLQAYLAVLDSQQEQTLQSLNSKDERLEEIDDHMEALEKVLTTIPIERVAPQTRERYTQSLANLQAEYTRLTEDAETVDEKKLKVQLLEQSCLVQNTIDHLKKLLVKHSSLSQRVIVEILKKNNVDIQVYFSGCILGGHCMIIAQHAKTILEEILAEMKKEVTDEGLIQVMVKFNKKMEEIFSVWYEICKTMMSTKYQDDDAIQKFEDNTEKLRSLVYNLVVEDPLFPGDENPLTLPTKLKWFMLLSGGYLRTLKVWHCIGDMGEDSIESFHVRRNNMSRRYCQTRGAKRHELILKALEFENAPWIHDGIQEMLDATKAKRAPVVRTTRQEQQAEVIIEDEVEADVESELLDFELELNESELLRVPADFTHDDAVLCEAVKRMDTKLHACPHCGMRLIGEATLNIHKNEKHKIFSKDNDAVEGKLR